ncbi:MAG: DUF47 family protein [Candidatus Verstraetearchaeota archaeon]|nr:DUF47 family protein [Candidatus Verstraetearchaeota archaeon]
MTFQREELSDLENRAYRRSLDLLADHARKVQDAIRELVFMVEEFVNGKDIQRHYERITKLEEEADEIKIELIDMLTKSAPGFLYREDFLRLIFKVEKIIEVAHTISRFVLKLSANKIKFEPCFGKALAELAAESLSAYEKLRDCIMALAMNPMNALKLVGEVHTAESNFDLSQQDLDLRIITEVQDPSLVLMCRDLISNLEYMVDAMEDASDDVRVLALHRVL